MTKPEQSREKARAWASRRGPGIVGQYKPGRGNPTKQWTPISSDLREIPDGKPWLLRAPDGATLRVLFPLPVEGDSLTFTAGDTEITLSWKRLIHERAA